MSFSPSDNYVKISCCFVIYFIYRKHDNKLIDRLIETGENSLQKSCRSREETS